MKDHEQELKALLTHQSFGADGVQAGVVGVAKSYARSYAQVTDGVAVLSDLQEDMCYIYAGRFGRAFGLPEYAECADSAFEHAVFAHVADSDVLERHVLELRFFNFVRSLPVAEKTCYYAACIVHFTKPGRSSVPVLHVTRYLHCNPNGSVRLGLCTYSPLPVSQGCVGGGIVNALTGETVSPELYEQHDIRLLSQRQREVLSLLAAGEGSKQIAERLHISVHTVNRHRQDILSVLGVPNTAAAVEIGLRMRLI